MSFSHHRTTPTPPPTYTLVRDLPRPSHNTTPDAVLVRDGKDGAAFLTQLEEAFTRFRAARFTNAVALVLMFVGAGGLIGGVVTAWVTSTRGDSSPEVSAVPAEVALCCVGDALLVAAMACVSLYRRAQAGAELTLSVAYEEGVLDSAAVAVSEEAVAGGPETYDRVFRQELAHARARHRVSHEGRGSLDTFDELYGGTACPIG